MRTITCRIPKKLDEELEAIAEKRKVSKSAIVCEAIVANLQQQKTRAVLSAYDVMKGACGLAKDRRRDLATNPKHMKGFGS